MKYSSKIVIAIVCIALFFLVACSATTEEPFQIEEDQVVEEVPSKDQQVDDIIAKKKAEEFTLPPAPDVPDDEVPTLDTLTVIVIPEESTLEEETPDHNVNIEAKAQEVLDVADLKVKSFSFVYREPPYNSGSDRFVVRGDKIRIVLGETNVNLARGISDVFLNTKTRQAVAYCIPRDAFLCQDKEGIKFSADYNEFYRKTNYEWMKDIVSAEYIGSEQMEGREVAVLKTQVRTAHTDWAFVRFYIEEFYGLPVKVDVVKTNGDIDTYNFDKVDINSYDDAYVTPANGY